MTGEGQGRAPRLGRRGGSAAPAAPLPPGDAATGGGTRGCCVGGREPPQSIDGTARFGVTALRDWEGRREAAGAGSSARLGSACSAQVAAINTNKPSSPGPAAPPKGLISSPQQREWGSPGRATASLLPLPAASVKPGLKTSLVLLGADPLGKGSIRGLPKAGPGFVAVVGHLGTGAGQLRECGDCELLTARQIPCDILSPSENASPGPK